MNGDTESRSKMDVEKIILKVMVEFQLFMKQKGTDQAAEKTIEEGLKKVLDIIWPPFTVEMTKISKRKRTYCHEHIQLLKSLKFVEVFVHLNHYIQYGSTAAALEILASHLSKSASCNAKPKKEHKKMIQKPSPSEIAALKGKAKAEREAYEADRQKLLPPDTPDLIEMDLKYLSDHTHLNDVQTRTILGAIDANIAKSIHYGRTKRAVTRCLCCYREFTNQQPRNSHVISLWYLRDIIEPGFLAPDLSHPHSKDELSLVRVDNMTLPMQCGQCEAAQDTYLEGPLSKCNSDVHAAMSSLRWSGCMPDDIIGAKPLNQCFITLRDQLQHSTLYNFLVCVLMRWIGSSLHQPDSVRFHSIFNTLRAEVHREARIDTDVPQLQHDHSELYLYAVPVGGELYHTALNYFKYQCYLSPSDGPHFWHDYLEGNAYFCAQLAPFICIVGHHPLTELDKYRIINDEKYVVMSLEHSGSTNDLAVRVILNNWSIFVKSGRQSCFDVLDTSRLSETTSVVGMTREKHFYYESRSFDQVLTDLGSNKIRLCVVYVLCSQFCLTATDSSYAASLSNVLQKQYVHLALDSLPFDEVHKFALYVCTITTEQYPIDILRSTNMNIAVSLLKLGLCFVDSYSFVHEFALAKMKHLTSFVMRMLNHYMYMNKV